jgi:predicted nucleotide-binding protein
MAKKLSKTETNREQTLLIKPHFQFESELKERIDIGTNLLREKINNASDYEKIKKEYFSWYDYNVELLKQSFNFPDNEYRKNYEEVGSYIGLFLGGNYDLAKEIENFIEKFNSKVDFLKNLHNKILLLKSYVEDQKHCKTDGSNIGKTHVFIVHGHDELVKVETARFIEHLELKPIILHEQASSGMTVIEKIEEYSNLVAFAIILYTPCDVGSMKGKENESKFRARQNVVFEHGFLMAKIGRENVAAMVKGDIEVPNDISGVVYIDMEKDWKLALAKELRKSGYQIDMNKVV